ncbi:MAG: GerMN domain-containing protein, partial [Clostridia bacterium]|nr:GerMN domain-containing protein [Clostridia bacterium]
LAVLLLILPLMGGCGVAGNPLEKAEATPVPGLAMKLHAASADQNSADVLQAVLYYRFYDEPMLAAETRALSVPKNESREIAIVRALLEGPSAAHSSELKRIIPETVTVESISQRNHILYITFNEALLTDDGIPADWLLRPEWAGSAPLQRALAIQSVVASVTESLPYTGVQILVYRSGQVQSSLRLPNEYFLTDGQTGLSEPQARNEALLLTPHNTVLALMTAWQERNYETLYRYVANTDGGDPKPTLQDVCGALGDCPSLSRFSAEAGSVALDGTRSVVNTLFSVVGESMTVTYPLPLVRENGIWKITYAQLRALTRAGAPDLIPD